MEHEKYAEEIPHNVIERRKASFPSMSMILVKILNFESTNYSRGEFHKNLHHYTDVISF